MAKDERRRQQRFVVNSVNLLVDNKSFPVIDISVLGARIACAASAFSTFDLHHAALEFISDEATEVFPIDAHIIRGTGLYVVIGYKEPRKDWLNYIRKFDTFHVHELNSNLFD